MEPPLLLAVFVTFVLAFALFLRVARWLLHEVPVLHFQKTELNGARAVATVCARAVASLVARRAEPALRAPAPPSYQPRHA